MGETELESLKRVEQVNELIKRMATNSGNDEETFREVDEFLQNNSHERIGFDRTSINKANTTGNYQDENISMNSFMQEIERDAKERAERKAEDRKKAEKFKEKANDYFKASDFKKAIDLYTKSIETCKDFDVLYTNRAQAFIKLGNCQSALDDCETALLLSENNHKALLHKGRALVQLNRFDEAIDCYKKVLELAPKLKKYIQEFFDEAEQRRDAAKMKKDSMLMFESSHSERDDVLDHIINKLITNDVEDTQFYAGGIQLLITSMSSNSQYVEILRSNCCNSSGLFDSKSKLQILIAGIISKKSSVVTEVEWIILSHWIELIGILVKNASQFSGVVLNIVPVYECLKFCLKSIEKLPPPLLLSATCSLYYISYSDLAVQQIFEKFPLCNVISLIIKSINTDKHNGLNIAGMVLFQNLAESQRFKIALGKEGDLLATVIDCLHSLFASSLSSDTDQIFSVISLIDSLSENSSIRLKLLVHDKFLNECVNTIEARVALFTDPKHLDILLKLFTFIHNLLVLTKNVPTSNKVRMIGERLVKSSSTLLANDPSVEMRSILIQVVSQMLMLLSDDQLIEWCKPQPQEGSTVDDNVSICRSMARRSSTTDQNYLTKVCKTLRLCIAILDVPHHPLLSHAIKILTLASRVSKAVLFLCCDVRERTLKLLSLLHKDKDPVDEVVVGNVCLLMMNSVEDTPLAEHLAHSAVIRDLLKICNDAFKADCRRNAAILAGKLAQSSHIHKTELARLNGFSIVSRFNSWS